jgi:hypothetical protein
MSFPKISQKEINKLRSLYNTKLVELKNENKKLKVQLEDRKETFKLNQELLYNTLQSLSENSENEEIIGKDNNNLQTLIEKSKIINDKLSLLIKEKTEKGKKMDIIKKEIPVIQEKILEQISILNTQSEQKNKEISSEDNIIKKLKLDLEKLRRNAFFKKARTEILVAPPTKNSVETNIELINTKNVFSKASKMHQEKKKKSEECWRSEKNLKDEMIKLKNNRLKENKIDKKDQVSYLREIGYNPLAEKYEKEEEEESEESEQSSSDDNSDGGGGDKKKKEKELKNLQEQLSKLQKKFNDYEKTINDYKKIYKDFKSKFEKLKSDDKND